MKFEDISRLADLVKTSGLSEIEVEEDGFRVKISNGGVRPLLTDLVPPSQPTVAVHDYVIPVNTQHSGAPVEVSVRADVTPEEQLHIVRSPMVGTFYSAPAPDVSNYVERDSVVHPSTVVCIIEAMKVMNEIQADVAGVIVDILVQSGQTVEYGQPLFKIKLS